MTRLLTLAALCGLFVGQIPAVYSQSEPQSAARIDNPPMSTEADLPPAPHGKTTIFGGAIQNFDPVRDQLTLNVVGEHPMRILFDERTQVFRDGKRIPLRDLGLADHASIETTLDGSSVFAVSIHILSVASEGEYRGNVAGYDPSTGTLSIMAGSSAAPFKILISANTQIARFGQSQFSSVRSGASDLIPGSLVSIKFQPEKAGQAVASTITVLAVPGSTFVFTGNLVSIDLHLGLLEVLDPSDQKSYQISFNNSLLQVSHTLHAGDRVRVNARYNGTGFVATDIAAN